jgi:hypothetical protein
MQAGGGGGGMAGLGGGFSGMGGGGMGGAMAGMGGGSPLGGDLTSDVAGNMGMVSTHVLQSKFACGAADRECA